MRLVPSRRGALRQRLLSRAPSTLPRHLQIQTVAGLRRHLQTAIELEHATIPTYLTALYTIEEGSNRAAAAIIRSVVMEEMLHMSLASNVLLAIGGSPRIDHRRFVPSYPTTLPHSDQSLLIGLERFSPAQIGVFMGIEQPAPAGAPPEANQYSTIGQFYAAIELALKKFSTEGGLFTGDPRLQVRPDQYYGGGGEIIAIDAPTEAGRLDQALEALGEIVGQGEGVNGGIDDGDDELFGQQVEVAHFFRFQQIACERYFQPGDTPTSGPSGDVLPVDWRRVYPMRKNPKLADYAPNSELWRMTRGFNRAYMRLLSVLHRAFNGEPSLVAQSVVSMYELRDRATALVKVPTDSGENAGPSFEWMEAD